MSKRFMLIATDRATNETQEYDGYMEDHDDYVCVYFRFVNVSTQNADFVSFFLRKNETYDTNDYHALMTNGIQDGGIRNNIMIRTCLKYMCYAYPYMKGIVLEDLVSENGMFITPKRLLLDRPGWYEEHFGAVKHTFSVSAINKLMRDAIFMKKNIKNIIKIVLDTSWGRIEDYREEMVHLLNTDWRIGRQTIEQYDVNIQSMYLHENSQPEWYKDFEENEDLIHTIRCRCKILQAEWFHEKHRIMGNY